MIKEYRSTDAPNWCSFCGTYVSFPHEHFNPEYNERHMTSNHIVLGRHCSKCFHVCLDDWKFCPMCGNTERYGDRFRCYAPPQPGAQPERSANETSDLERLRGLISDLNDFVIDFDGHVPGDHALRLIKRAGLPVNAEAEAAVMKRAGLPVETTAHRTDSRLAGDIEYCLAKINPATDVHAILTQVMLDLRSPKEMSGPRSIISDNGRVEVRMLADNLPQKAAVPACGNPVMVNSEWYGPCTKPSGHEGDCERTVKASAPHKHTWKGTEDPWDEYCIVCGFKPSPQRSENGDDQHE